MRKLFSRALVLIAALSGVASASPRAVESRPFNAVVYRPREIPDPRVERALLRYFPRAKRALGVEDVPLDPGVVLPGELSELSIRFVRNPQLKGPEGSFALKLSPRPAPKAVIWYREASGAFYGLAMAADLVRGGRVVPADLTENPSFRWRGVSEGFYGRPWSAKVREDFVRWMGRRRLNLFVLAAKDEDTLRKHWRRPLSPEELGSLRSFLAAARENFVEVAWTLSPVGARASDPVDVAAAVKKYEAALSAGVGRLVLAFDDTDPDSQQVEFANRVLAALVVSHPHVDMTFVPALYWGDAVGPAYLPSPYLKHVAESLDQRFRVGWTGPQIISRAIRAEDAARFSSFIRHRLVLGDNYPVQDRLLDSGRLFLGPLVGRDPGLARFNEAWVSNASPLAEAAKIPLHTAADFAWDCARYDPGRSWAQSLAQSGGPAGEKWLALLARENSSSWLSDPDSFSPGGIKNAVSAYETGDARPLKALLEELAGFSAKLESGLKSNPQLYRELKPWALKLGLQAEAASAESEPRRLAALRAESQLNPALVCDLALDRFLSRASFPQGGEACRLAPVQDSLRAYIAGRLASARARSALDALAQGPWKLNQLLSAEKFSSGESGWVRELLPWVDTLAEEASRASAGVDSPGSIFFRLGVVGWADDWIWRGKIRLGWVPLWVTRRLMEDFLSESELSWRGKPRAPAEPAALRLWLWIWGWRHPASFPVVLARHLTGYRDSSNVEGLATIFRALRDLPARVRGGPACLSEEIWPWLDKAGEYGVVGLKALELNERARKGSISAEQQAEWTALREHLRSANGLELALELKLFLEAFHGRQRLPPEVRPKKLDLTLPANPVDIL